MMPKKKKITPEGNPNATEVRDAVTFIAGLCLGLAKIKAYELGFLTPGTEWLFCARVVNALVASTHKTIDVPPVKEDD